MSEQPQQISMREAAERLAASRAPQPTEPAPAPEPEPTPARAPEAAAPEPETPEAPEAPEATLEGADVEASAETPETEATPEGEAEEVALENLSDLAEYLGADVSEMYNLKVRVTGPDGQPQDVTLGEWKDGYQATMAAREAKANADTMRQQVEAERQKLQQQQAQQAQEQQALLGWMQQQLTGQMNDAQMQQLRMEQPDEWAARMTQHNQTMAQLNQMRAYLGQQVTQLQDQRAAEYHKQISEARAKSNEKVLALIPEWKDSKTREADEAAIAVMLKEMGFSDPDIYGEQDGRGRWVKPGITDHRQVAILRDALKYREQRKEAKAATKKVVKVGKAKTAKPGASQGPAQAQASQIKNLRARARKTGKLQDALAAYRAQKGR